MKVASLEVVFCDAGWRPWMFLKATTDEGQAGWAEITISNGSPHGLAGAIEDLAPLVVGRDPRATERISSDLYRAMRQSVGGVVGNAIGGIENALLDLKARALGVPVYELFGGPTRDSVPVYWSHCGTTRARAWQATGTPKLASYEDVAALGREVVERGYRAFKTNIVVPGAEPQVRMAGFRPGVVGDSVSAEMIGELTRLFEAFRQGTGDSAEPMLDLNFNVSADGALRIAAALAPFGLAWIEFDSYEPSAVAAVRRRAPMPVCSGENLLGARAFRPFLESAAMDIVSVDVIWNGFAQARKIADLAETFDVPCVPHNHYSHLATFIAAQWCAATTNVRILEVDVDDVPWKDELVTAVPQIENGELAIPVGPGWGVELNEDVLRAHPWPRSS
jgi:L-alanine-DL-glutamate epimerase-like enolase superfamily enzyme